MDEIFSRYNIVHVDHLSFEWVILMDWWWWWLHMKFLKLFQRTALLIFGQLKPNIRLMETLERNSWELRGWWQLIIWGPGRLKTSSITKQHQTHRTLRLKSSNIYTAECSNLMIWIQFFFSIFWLVWPQFSAIIYSKNEDTEPHFVRRQKLRD